MGAPWWPDQSGGANAGRPVSSGPGCGLIEVAALGHAWETGPQDVLKGCMWVARERDVEDGVTQSTSWNPLDTSRREEMGSRRFSDWPRVLPRTVLKPGWAALKQLSVPRVTMCLGAAEPVVTHRGCSL